MPRRNLADLILIDPGTPFNFLTFVLKDFQPAVGLFRFSTYASFCAGRDSSPVDSSHFLFLTRHCADHRAAYRS
jgi:hypothetical protein